jgi:hypothetical protein
MGNGSPLLHTIRALSVALLACAAVSIVEPARAETTVPLPAAADTATVVDTAVATVEPVVAAAPSAPTLTVSAAPPVSVAPVAVPHAVRAATVAPTDAIVRPAPAPAPAPVLRPVPVTAPTATARTVRVARPAAIATRPKRTARHTKRAVAQHRRLNLPPAHPHLRRPAGGHSGATAATFDPVAAAAQPSSSRVQQLEPRSSTESPGPAMAGRAAPPTGSGAGSPPVSASTLPFALPAPRPPTGTWPDRTAVHAEPIALAFERPG